MSKTLSLSKQRLIRKLGYQFTDASLLELALTHRSYGSHNNERLEFLGDSLLGVTISEALYLKFPEAREGQLSNIRSKLVKGETLAEIAREFELGENLILGEGELKSGGFRRDSILADTVEALIGAIFMDADMAVCQERVLAWYDSRLTSLTLDTPQKDSKTLLQEFMQSRKKPLPEYTVEAVGGEAHAQIYTVSCKIALIQKVTQATASSRKQAEKMAASEAIDLLEQAGFNVSGGKSKKA